MGQQVGIAIIPTLRDHQRNQEMVGVPAPEAMPGFVRALSLLITPSQARVM
jgi:hypothetical protein